MISVENPPGAAGLPVAPGRLHRITLEQYDRLVAIGFFGTYNRLVLLDGFLVDKLPKEPRHSTACGAGRTAIEAALPTDWHVRQGGPLYLPGGPIGYGSAPEPDHAVVAGRPIAYPEHHPGPADVALVVESADCRLAEERSALARYAWAGIPVAWIVDLSADAVEVYSGPSGPVAGAGDAGSAVKRAGDLLAFPLPGRDGGEPAVDVGPFDVSALII